MTEQPTDPTPIKDNLAKIMARYRFPDLPVDWPPLDDNNGWDPLTERQAALLEVRLVAHGFTTHHASRAKLINRFAGHPVDKLTHLNYAQGYKFWQWFMERERLEAKGALPARREEPKEKQGADRGKK